MNRHEFQKQKHLKDDMKKKFDDNTEFAKEFANDKNNYYDNENKFSLENKFSFDNKFSDENDDNSNSKDN